MKTLLLVLPLTLSAAPPVISLMDPWGAQRGKAITVTLIGSNLTEGAKIVSTLPAAFTPLSPPDATGKKLPFLVELKADAAPGLYPVRIESRNGLSNIVLFSLGAFPEVREAESELLAPEAKNDSTATAEAVKATPVVVNGTLRPADRDTYQITAKAGERRLIEVEARRMGSAVDPALRILDSAGKVLARTDDTLGLGVDCRIDFTFPREGTYFVEVHDARFSDQTANFYRLKMGSYQYAESIFPMGWKRGEPVDIELAGGNLPAPVKVKAEWVQDAGWARVPNSPGALPFPVLSSDLTESLEPAGAGPHALTANTVANGRIAKPGERDRYTLAVKPGANYLIELQARGSGPSRLDGVITVYDSNGKKLDSAGDEPPKQSVFATIAAGDVSSDPYLSFTAPPSAKQVVIAVDDVAQGGGPGHVYRLIVRQQPPDFTLTLSTPYVNVPANGTAIVNVNVERRGFAGPIQLAVANLPEDLEASGGIVPLEMILADGRGVSRRGVLMLSAKPGAKPRTLEMEVWGEAKLEDGTVIRRKAASPGMITAIRGTLGFVDPNRRNQNKPFTAPWLGLDLPALIGNETPGALKVNSPRRVRLIQGMKHEFEWSFDSRNPGVRAPMAVATDAVGALDLRITDRGSERKAGSGALTMNTTISTPTSTFDVILSARAGSGMDEEVVYAPAITVDVVQGYFVDAPAQTGPFAPGGKTELVGKVRREAAFTMPVTVAPDALPLGVNCQPVEVPPGVEEYRIACQADASAPAGEHKILLNPASILPEGEKGKVPYKIGAVEAVLTIAK